MLERGITMLRKLNYLFLFMLMLTLSMLMFGCSSTEDDSNQKKEVSESTSTAFPVEVRDGSGESIKIEEKPDTIVSLLPSNTETAYALGLGEKIIGVSDYCNFPTEAADKPKVGGLEINIEKVLELNPDLLLLSASHFNNAKDTIKQFQTAGIDVIIVPDANSFDGAYGTIELIAKATGTSDKADEIISDMKKEVAEIKEKASAIKDKKKVWIEVSSSPDLYTAANGTYIDEMLDIIQAENIAADQEGWVTMNEEQVIDRNPDVILTTYGYYIENPEEKVYGRKAWSEVPAVQNKQVYDVDNDTVSRPGPRLTEGLQLIAEKIYPEIFK